MKPVHLISFHYGRKRHPDINLLLRLHLVLRIMASQYKIKRTVQNVGFVPRIIEVYLTVEKLPSAFQHVVEATGKSLLKPPKK